MPHSPASDASDMPLEPRVLPPALQAARGRKLHPENQPPSYDGQPRSTMEVPELRSKPEPVSQQPQASAKMQINSLNGKDLPFGHDGTREWSHNIYEYTDTGAVVKAAFCPCVVYARNAERLDHLDRHEVPHPRPNGNGNCAQCCGHGLASLLLFSCCLNMCLRSKVRERYSIGESCDQGCIRSWALYPCALHQEDREIELEELQLRAMGLDAKEFYSGQGGSGGYSAFTPTTSNIGGNGCSCFMCCFLCPC